MRDLWRGLLVGLVVLAVGGALASRLGVAAVDVPRSTTTAPWFLARATGVTAFAALTVDVIVGLLVSTRAAQRVFAKGAGVDLHTWLSPLALALVLAHACVLLADSYIRFDILDAFIPFASSYERIAVGLGVIAGYLALVVHASFALRKRIGPKRWRRLHYLSFVAWLVAATHGVIAGSDTGSPWMRGLYAVSFAVVGGLIALRIVRR